MKTSSLAVNAHEVLQVFFLHVSSSRDVFPHELRDTLLEQVVEEEEALLALHVNFQLVDVELRIVILLWQESVKLLLETEPLENFLCNCGGEYLKILYWIQVRHNEGQLKV